MFTSGILYCQDLPTKEIDTLKLPRVLKDSIVSKLIIRKGQLIKIDFLQKALEECQFAKDLRDQRIVNYELDITKLKSINETLRFDSKLKDEKFVLKDEQLGIQKVLTKKNWGKGFWFGSGTVAIIITALKLFVFK